MKADGSNAVQLLLLIGEDADADDAPRPRGGGGGGFLRPRRDWLNQLRARTVLK